MKLTVEELRALGRWAAATATRVLPLFEAEAPGDPRPREAIAAIRRFARGGKRTAQLRTVAWAAYAAAREVDDPIAAAAARAAGHAAGTAYLHPLATTDQAKHILGPAVYAARAAGEKELRWAIAHAPPAVRTLLRRMPRRAAGRTALDALYHQLDAGLRR